MKNEDLKRRLVVVLVVVLACLLAGGGPVSARQGWLTWNTRTGLPSNDLTCMAITKGRIAVGTPKGIAVFCEERPTWIDFSVYGETFGSLVVRDLDFDPAGNLWVATPNGLGFIEMGRFPQEAPRLEIFGTDHGLSTIDVEVLQVVESNLYVGCFGGWLFHSVVGAGGAPSFRPVQNLGNETPDDRKFMDVGISALAMDLPGGGIFSTKGRGLVSASNGDAYVVAQEPLPSDWIDDFWAFQQGGANHVIALAQNRMFLIRDRRLEATIQLPDPDAAVSCLTTFPDEDVNVDHPGETPQQRQLRLFLGKRILVMGTRGQGLWLCDEGVWSRLTTADCPLPSDTINRVHYLHGAKKVAILSDAGLTMFGTEEQDQYDEFKHFGSGKAFAKIFWPFMSRWGPRIFGYPWHKDYPIAEYISYYKILRGRDIWISHARGISRFIYPQAFFLGAMAMEYRLSGRFENPLHDPGKNLLIEDNSTSGGKPAGLDGERIWHHYCREQPTDRALYDLATIFTTLDRKTLAGPLNQLVIEGQPAGTDPDSLASQIETASQTLGFPPVPVFRDGETFFDRRGHQMFSIDALSPNCPLHPIPQLPIDDMAIDAGERCWGVFTGTSLACLDESASVPAEGRGNFAPGGDSWHVFAPGQLPWDAGERVTCVRRVGVDIYVGTERSGLFVLPRAHLHRPEDLTADAWTALKPAGDPEDPDRQMSVIDCCHWRTRDGTVVAVLHREALSIYDGERVVSLPVPKRSYTCMAADRTGTLWVGSFQGLLRIGPDRTIATAGGKGEGFKSDRVVALAAAPDNAKYPYLVAVSVDEKAGEERGHLRLSDVPPMVTHERDNPYRLRLIPLPIEGAQMLLWDGRVWEPFNYPGIHSLMFDETYLWCATSCRVMRYYLPTIVQNY